MKYLAIFNKNDLSLICFEQYNDDNFNSSKYNDNEKISFECTIDELQKNCLKLKSDLSGFEEDENLVLLYEEKVYNKFNSERDRLIRFYKDWIVSPHNASANCVDYVTAYLQALRDLPEQEGFNANNPTWPDVPVYEKDN